MKSINTVAVQILRPANSGITHNRNTAAWLHVYTCAFETMRKCMIGSKLMSHFMCQIIYYKKFK